MNQYGLEFEKDVQSYYTDQAPSSGVVSSFYTSYGIKAIDSQYCTLIQNIHLPIKQVYQINRRRYENFCVIKTREVIMSFEYKNFHDPIEINESCYDVRIEWENGYYKDFIYDRIPQLDPITRKSDPKLLALSIKENPHLHVMIKENLLGNLENYLKMV